MNERDLTAKQELDLSLIERASSNKKGSVHIWWINSQEVTDKVIFALVNTIKLHNTCPKIDITINCSHPRYADNVTREGAEYLYEFIKDYTDESKSVNNLSVHLNSKHKDIQDKIRDINKILEVKKSSMMEELPER